MWPDRVSNLGPLANESDVLLTVLCRLALSAYKTEVYPTIITVDMKISLL